MDDMTLDLTPRGAASIEALVNGPIQTNSYAVISNDECLIVDPAWEGERLVEHIRTAHPEVRVLGSVCTMLAGLPGFELSLATAHYMSCALRT